MSDSDHFTPDDSGTSGPSASGGSVGETALPTTSLLPMGPSWQEQDSLLRELWLQNKTQQEISEILNRSVAAIMTRAARLGLPRRSAPGRKPGSRRLPGAQDQQGTPRTVSQPRTVARAMRDATENAPQPSARICLMCLRSFQSMGRHNRICPSCKSSSEYVSATSMPDIHLPI